jgi:hypothetical protein
MMPITLNLESVVKLTHEEFYRLCAENPEAKLELSSSGELIVMSPTGGVSGNRNMRLTQRIGNWAERDGTGIAFDSSTMFDLFDLFPGSAWEYRLEAPASLSQVAGATQAPFPGRAWEREQTRANESKKSSPASQRSRGSRAK